MAFQVGEVKISGTIDDLSFYKSVFGWLVRRKGGPTRKQFKSSPAFERSRENSSEFTRCSQAASAMRKLIIKHTSIKHKTIYHRLIKLMRLLANADQTSPRGRRDPLKDMHTKQGQLLLKDFEITPELTLYKLLVSVGLLKAASVSTEHRRKKTFHFHSRYSTASLLKPGLIHPTKLALLKPTVYHV
jgi:hypothetical protein